MGKNLLLWLIIAAVLLTVFNNFNPRPQPQEIAYSSFVTEVQQDQVHEVQINGLVIIGKRKSGEDFKVIRPPIDDPKLMDELINHNVNVVGEAPEQQSIWAQLLIASFPILIIIAVFMLFMRQMQGGAGGRGGPMAFGKSKARLLSEDQIKTTFADVAGVDEAKEDVQELVDFLRDPGKFQKLGGRIPRGILMVGPPGTGKTLLAKAIAGEAKVPFFTISGSDFVEMFVGVGASRVRDMFEQAKKQSPCIIFIDEIDAVGRHRGAGLGGGHDEREQTLNQLLVEMDGFEPNDGIIVIAATNRPDVLDPALLRPGRFDRRVVVPRPDFRGRYEILKVHTRRVPLADDVDLEVIGRGTPGFVGADLQNLVNEAALLAARREATRVAMVDFERAKDKVLLGAERRSLVMTDEDKRITAYHEGGHALVAMLTEGSDPVHKVTIIPRGMALGVTQTLPPEDRYNLTRGQILAMIKHAMGGRAAEEIVFGHLSTGASNDLQQATRLARQMVCKYGMSEKLGPVSYGDDDHDVFLGRDFMTRKDFSEKKAEEIDEEVSQLLNALYLEARTLLLENRAVLDRIAASLLERETLDTSDLRLLLAGQTLPPLVTPKAGETAAEPRREAKPEPLPKFPGKKLPDPEPMPG